MSTKKNISNKEIEYVIVSPGSSGNGGRGENFFYMNNI